MPTATEPETRHGAQTRRSLPQQQAIGSRYYHFIMGTPEYESACRAIEAAVMANPRRATFGWYAGGCEPQAIALFAWFPTEDALFDALAAHLPYMGGDTSSPVATGQAVREVLARYQGDGKWSQECFSELKAVFAGVQSLYWIGRFEDLCVGDAAFCRDHRLEFRRAQDECEEDDSSPRHSRPIAKRQIGEFISWLSECGF